MVFRDFRALEEHADAVVVCTPTDSHTEIANWFLSRSIDTLCEKPLGRSMDEVDRVLNTAQRYDSNLIVALVRRYDEQWLKLGEEILQGAIGRPVVWRQLAASFGPIDKPWYNDKSVGRGPLFDEALHTIDFAIELLGPVDSVYASGLTLRSGNSAVDTGLAVVHFAKGDALHFGTSWGLPRGCRGDSLFDVLGPSGIVKLSRKDDRSEMGRFVVDSGASRRVVYSSARSLNQAFLRLANIFVDTVTGMRGESQELAGVREAHRVVVAIMDSISSREAVRLS